MQKGILLLILVLLLSCGKDEIAQRTIPAYPPNDALIRVASIAGKVIDKNGDVLTDVKVSINADGTIITETSNENGAFQFEDVSIKGDYAYLQYAKDEYFDGFQSLSIIPNSYNYTQAKLINKNVSSIFEATEDGEIVITNGPEILIPKNSMVDKNGNEYSGEVKAYVRYVDPTGDDFAEEIIGGLTGIGLDDNFVGLQSYGMVQVELLGKDGQELNLNGNEKAEIEFPIPQGITNLPAEIPVWSFDEEQGIWIEEEMAILGNGKYITEVSHFSAWNLDIIIDNPVSLYGKIYIDNIPAANHGVLIKFDDVGTIGGRLNRNGEFDLKTFPSGQDFSVYLINQCNESTEIQTFTGLTASDSIIIYSEFNVDPIELDGIVFNCEGNPIKEGVFYYNNFPYPIDSSGYFKIAHCPGLSNQVVIIDEENLNTKVFTLSENQPFDNLQVCNDPNSQFIVSMIGGRCVQNSPLVSYEIDTENNHIIIFDLYEHNYKIVRHNIRFQISEPYTLPMEFNVNVPIKVLSLYCPENEGGNFNSLGGFPFSESYFPDAKKVIITDYTPNETIKGHFDFNTTFPGTIPTMTFELNITE